MTKRLLVSVLALFFCASLSAKVEMAGLYSSFKGVGVSVIDCQERNSFVSISALADTYGMYSFSDAIPGFKLNVSRLYYLTGYKYGDAKLYIFGGGGGTAGYVHDYGLSEGGLMPMGAASGTLGIVTDNPRRLNVSMSFTAELGLCGSRKGAIWYINGIQRALYPEIIIFWKF